MKIQSFFAEGLHGYLTVNVEFFDDITFLTGINGSGKTTVIYSIVALITPNLFILANLEFGRMVLRIEHDGKNLAVTATKTSDSVTLYFSDTSESFQFPVFVPDQDEPSYRASEREGEFYRELAVTHGSNAVLRAINSLPTPMFLDLDRRSRATSERLARTYITRRNRRGRNVFSLSLMQSLLQATSLAEAQYHETQSRLRRLGEDSRRDLIINLLSLESGSYGPLEKPTPEEIALLQKVRRSAHRFPQLLQVPMDAVMGTLVPFLDQMDSFAKAIPPKKSIEGILKDATGSENKELQALIGWSANRSQLNKITKMTEIVSAFNEKSDSVSSSINSYVEMVNRFLSDSGKRIFFDDTGALCFKLGDGSEPRSISTLSSGEAQIFVILTHLCFNPAAQLANVFIIDEPELSLHVQWQELFVESVQAANPNVQYIMATHAPSIILSRVDKCFDMSVAGAARGSLLT